MTWTANRGPRGRFWGPLPSSVSKQTRIKSIVSHFAVLFCVESSFELGYDILSDLPDADPETDEDAVEIELSDSPLPNLYSLRGESPNDRWVLLQDLSNMLKIKSRDALLRQLCPSGSPTSSSSNSAPVNYKTILRELKMSDFLEQAHCCQFLNSGEKINTRASKIALIKYTDKVKELLNVESVVVTAS